MSFLDANSVSFGSFFSLKEFSQLNCLTVREHSQRTLYFKNDVFHTRAVTDDIKIITGLVLEINAPFPDAFHIRFQYDGRWKEIVIYFIRMVTQNHLKT